MRKRIYRICALLGAFVCLLPTLACLNDYSEISPVRHFTGGDVIKELLTILKRDRAEEAKELRKAQQNLLDKQKKEDHELPEAEWGIPSDIATIHLRLGETAQGVAILEQLAQTHGDKYNVNANLGTAYELAGQNEKALAFLTKALNINKESHRGSEWIHIKILEAKIAMKQNPDWLKTHNILGERAESILASGDKKKIEGLLRDLGYQLFERVHFIAPKNAMMGDLIMQLGDIYLAQEELDNAYKSYQLAEDYTVSVPEKLRQAKEECQKLRNKASIEKAKPEIAAKKKQLEEARDARNRRLYWVAVILGVVVVGSWIVYYKRR